MNKITRLAAHLFAAVHLAPRRWMVLGCAALWWPLPPAALAGERHFLPPCVPAALTNLAPIRPLSRWTRMNLTLSLPLRDREGLTNLLQQLYDRTSPRYHQFLTPEQFTEQFGPTESDYQRVADFAQAHGLVVTGKHSNRMLINARGTAAAVEKAFQIQLHEYQHPQESRKFFAPNGVPSVDPAVPLLAVSGMDNYVLPHACLKPRLTRPGSPQLTGSGPGGAFLGNDFRAAYVPGVPLTGTGQIVGLLEFDSGFYQSDITAYETLTGLPNVPVSAVLIDGYGGAAGGGNVEVSLDIEMAISMAPGLKQILVYEGSSTDDILNRMATDNLAKTIGASWTYGIDSATEQIFLQFAAQGQSFFNASGDSDAYTGAIPTPSDDPNITIVGGTTLTTTGAGGSWASEKVWNWGGGVGSSGGISTVYSIPQWQKGINMGNNQGSTTMRNLPDVAMTADNVYVIYGNGQSGAFGGTSCATPLWAGFTALINELALANGQPLAGFINPAVYAIGKGSNSMSYSSLFHDTTAGNNESATSSTRFSAVAGYDLCTGWGTPTGSNLITALGFPEPLRITPSGGAVMTGPVGGPFNPIEQNYLLINNGVGPLSWSLANTSAWLNISATSGTLIRGGPATSVAVRLDPNTTNFTAGLYVASLTFSNLTDQFAQTRQISLAVVTSPVITSQPTNLALLEGTTATFSVGIATNALMFYQWQLNGVNLADGGKVSGSATSTLTISGIHSANVGAYSVILSNAAGVLQSSNASLTLVPSAPVIVSQPTNQSVLPGAPASFSVTAVGTTPYLYQWQFNGTNLSNGGGVVGVKTSTLTLSNVFTANAGIYTVIVSNLLGSVTSTGAVLTVIPVTAAGVNMTTMRSFSGGASYGAYPYSPLVQGLDGNFYGTTVEGGSQGVGTAFRITPSGALTTLLSFGNNGAFPYAGLALGKDGLFYGATYSGGAYSDGTLFKMNSGGVIITLVSFNGLNGQLPVAGLVQANDGNFYGTANQGGDYGFGTLFRMSASGALTSLVSFNSGDGAYPSPMLVQGRDGYLYGTTELGGTNGGGGTLFKVSPAGNFSSLYSFTGQRDGSQVVAGIVQGVDGNFYGNTWSGGSYGLGTVFRLTPTGEFTSLYSFTGGEDGALPWGGLMQASDGNLYGTTQSGGRYGDGTVFQISPGGQLSTLVQFEGYNGASPSAALVQGQDGNLYSTTQTGGAAGYGTVFKIAFSGPLQITGQPADQSAYLGGSAMFGVATLGGSPVSYQWLQDGVPLTDGGGISGSSTANLLITNVTFADAALYSVIVSNAFGSSTSQEAVLEVMYAPAHIVSHPASQSVVVGSTVNLTVVAQGNPSLHYQWQENGMNLTDGGNISGSTTSTLTLTGVSLTNSGSYSVVVSNLLHSVYSGPAALTVLPASPAYVSFSTVRFLLGATDGALPYGGLIQAKNGNFYGTAQASALGYGAVYGISGAGSITTLFDFNGGNGAAPAGGVIQAANGLFYGTTSQGGASGYGTVFRMSTISGVTSLYSFTGGSDGAGPIGALVQGRDGNFYGTTYQGGDNSFGTIFKITSAGNLTSLYQFGGSSDGAYPYGNLTLGRDGNFYGTTLLAGAQGYGTIFKVTPNGLLTTLASFDYVHGGYPEAGVVQGGDGNFYGTTYLGGAGGQGTVFSLGTDGTINTLVSFQGTNGSNPAAALVQGTDGNFYGNTSSGGVGGQGTVFKISTNGTLSTLLWFDGLNGANPQSALIQARNGTFYGTTPEGGRTYNPSAGGGYGLIYQLTVPTFSSSPFGVAPAIACLPYAASLTNMAVAPVGDSLSFGKVSGPAWLNVSVNGTLSGTPTNADIGTNLFMVSLTDANGVLATASMTIVVVADPPPSFLSNPFAEGWANVDEVYGASIATNGTAPYLQAGDILTFGKVSGPAWLTVAPDGRLSGTPQGSDGGSNTFIVSVTNLGGSSNTAVLNLYVNRAPFFNSPYFTEPAATAGIGYQGTLASEATDLDLAAGDVLVFYKVTGPAWLNVASNGTLSGTPSAGDLGTDGFLVLVVDSGGLAGVGMMGIAVNADRPPRFVGNPFTEIAVIAGQSYSATISTNASDPDPGDVLSFAKISGPGWLSVAPNGTLSGIPLSTNAGPNLFSLLVTDSSGLSANGTMEIDVTTIPLVAGLSFSGSNLLLSWSGGVPPYQVQLNTNLEMSGWRNVSVPTSATNLVLSVTNAAGFYRIQGH